MPPLNNLKSQADKHKLPDNKDVWMTDSVSMVVWRRMKRGEKHIQKASVSECLLCTWTHIWARVGAWVCMSKHILMVFKPRMGWNGELVLTVRVFLSYFLRTYQIVHSVQGFNFSQTFSLHLSHISTSREGSRHRLSALFFSNPTQQHACTPPDGPLWTVTAG